MLGEGTPAIFITFLLAVIGYVGLTSTVVLSVRGTYMPALWRGISLVIVSHVLMVWTFRYSWQFDLAVRNGYVGFLLFHSALSMIVLSNLVAEETAQKLIHVVFCIVTMGALGASFIYEAVSMYRMIVIACALIGGFFLVRHYVGNRRLFKRMWRSRTEDRP